MSNDKYFCIVNSILGYQTRTEDHQGRPHIIVPVVMMVEGVHAGSAGPVLHLAEELSQFPHTWNGIPVSIEHPQEDGSFVSCNSPGVIDSQVVGRVFNVRWDDKLKGELWLDQEHLTTIAPEVLSMVKAGTQIEISAGLFSEDEQTSGEWNGEAYDLISRNHRPDHLAILLEGEGACSLADGCGIRANRGGGETVEMNAELIKNLKSLAEKGISFKINEAGFQELSSQIQQKLDRMDDDLKLHFLVEAFEDSFVYEIRPRMDSPALSPNGGPVLLRRTYTVNNDVVEFTGEPVPVVRKVEFAVLQANQDEGGENRMGGDGKKKECPGCPEKVALLIANEQTKWKAEDEDKLLALGQDLGEEFLDDMLPVEVEKPETDDEANVDGETKTGDGDEKETQMDKEKAVEVLKEQLSDPDKFLELLPDEHRDQMKSALALHKAQRNDLMGIIVANSSFIPAELETKSIDELQKIAAMTPAPVDYSALNAGGGEGTGSGEKPMGTPEMNKKEK